VIGVRVGKQDLAHAADHSHLSGPPLWALDDRLAVAGYHQLGAEVLREPLVEEGRRQLETVRTLALHRAVDLP